MDWSLITSIFAHILNGVPLAVAAIVILVAGRSLFLRTMPFDPDRELIAKQNKAYSVVLAAYLFSAALALSGTFFGSREDAMLIALGELLAEGVLVIVLLRVSIWVNDRFILSRFSIAKEIGEDQNLGVGFCVAGSCVACGLILNGALTGFSKNFVLGLRDIVLFWALGQTVLVLACYGYRKMMRYDVHRLIEYDNNVAAGVGFGGFLVGLGIIMRSALVGSGQESLGAELAITAVIAVVGAAILLAINSPILFLLLPKANYEEEVEMNCNVAASVVMLCATVATALFLGSIIQR